MSEQLTNTVSLKVNEFVGKVTTYIKNTCTNPKFLGKQKAFMEWGPPGVGKSAALFTIKKNVEKSTGKKVIITDVRLLLFNPVDLRGIPVPDANKEFAIWLKPKIFQMDPSEDVINILMLDEISAAPPSVQAAAYQITLDRKIGEHLLPDNCYIICAGNRVQDKSVAYKMPKALANRLTHFDIKPEIDDWKVWAIEAGINPQILAYLNNFDSDLYMFDNKTDDNAYPSPRTWEMASDYIEVYGSLKEAFDCVAGCIGWGTANKFKRYCAVFDKLPNMEDILAGKPDIKIPTQPDVLYALSATLVNTVGNKVSKVNGSQQLSAEDSKQIANIIKFSAKMEKEFSVLTIRDMVLIPKVKDILITLPEWIAWASEHNCYIV